jgi:hypothetical protein
MSVKVSEYLCVYLYSYIYTFVCACVCMEAMNHTMQYHTFASAEMTRCVCVSTSQAISPNQPAHFCSSAPSIFQLTCSTCSPLYCRICAGRPFPSHSIPSHPMLTQLNQAINECRRTAKHPPRPRHRRRDQHEQAMCATICAWQTDGRPLSCTPWTSIPPSSLTSSPLHSSHTSHPPAPLPLHHVTT